MLVKTNTLLNDGDIKVIANKFRWRYLKQDQLNLLSTSPADATLSKNKKMIL